MQLQCHIVMFHPASHSLCCSSQVTGITTAAARAAPLWALLCPPGGCAAGGPGSASWAAACAVMAGHRREFMLTGLTIHGRPELGAFTLRFRCNIQSLFIETRPYYDALFVQRGAACGFVRLPYVVAPQM
jgi:hypothetical protein